LLQKSKAVERLFTHSESGAIALPRTECLGSSLNALPTAPPAHAQVE
jgi:hypothetical protein